MTRPLQAASVENYEAELRRMDVKFLSAIGAAFLSAAFTIVGWLMVASLEGSLAASIEIIGEERMRAMEEYRRAGWQLASDIRICEHRLVKAYADGERQGDKVRECCYGFAGLDPRRERDGLNPGGGDLPVATSESPIRLESE